MTMPPIDGDTAGLLSLVAEVVQDVIDNTPAMLTAEELASLDCDPDELPTEDIVDPTGPESDE